MNSHNPKQKNHLPTIGIFFLLPLCLNFIPQRVQAAGNNWYVRPYGGSYGAADGTSYENAWSGLGAHATFSVTDLANDVVTVAAGGFVIDKTPIFFSSTGTLPAPLVSGQIYYAKWNSGAFTIKISTDPNNLAGTVVDITDNGDGIHSIDMGPYWPAINPEDTLFVCGTHDAPGQNDVQLNIGKAGTSDSARIKISGECPGDEGIIVGAGGKFTTWTGPDTYGAYQTAYPGGSYPTGFVPDTANHDLTRLQNAGKAPDGTWVENNYFADLTGYKLYYKPAGGDISGKIFYAIGYASPINISGKDWVTVEKLRILGASSGATVDNSKNVILDSLYIRWTCRSITVLNSSHNGILRDSTIKDGGNGIYHITYSCPGVSNNWLIERSTFKNIDDGVYTGAPDHHAIGLLGAGHIVRNCYFDTASTAITLYSDAIIPCASSIEAYNNYAQNITVPPHGAAYDFHGGTGGQVDVFFHDNIAKNCYQGIRGLQATHSFKAYNNTLESCNMGINVGANAAVLHADLRNNVITNPVDIGFVTDDLGLSRGYNQPLFIRVYGSMGSDLTSDFVSNNNLFWPNAEGNYFFRAIASFPPPISFSAWKSATNGQDNSSLTSNPLFTNATGNFSEATDFKLQSNSPAIDAGADVGLTKDYAGDTVPQGSAPDIGAYEHAASSPPSFFQCRS